MRRLLFWKVLLGLSLFYSGVVLAYVTGTVPRKALDAPSIVFYLTEPDTPSYPILVMLEGSASQGHLSSVVHSHTVIGNPFIQMGLGLLTVEQWGIDSHTIDEPVFWKHYTRTQRFSDHQRVIEYLEKHPPQGWDGSFVFLGGSEGGALATALMLKYPDRTLATVNWIGAVDWNWEEQFWHFYEFERAHGQPIEADIPATKKAYDALVHKIQQHPTADKWLGGMTYLYHADAYGQPPYDYRHMKTPLLVVVGDQDSIVSSTDVFVEKAKKAGAPVTYLRVKGMRHEVSDQAVMDSIHWLQGILPPYEGAEVLAKKNPRHSRIGGF